MLLKLILTVKISSFTIFITLKYISSPVAQQSPRPRQGLLDPRKPFVHFILLSIRRVPFVVSDKENKVPQVRNPPEKTAKSCKHLRFLRHEAGHFSFYRRWFFLSNLSLWSWKFSKLLFQVISVNVGYRFNLFLWIDYTVVRNTFCIFRIRLTIHWLNHSVYNQRQRELRRIPC